MKALFARSIALGVLFASLGSVNAFAYYGKRSTEAVLTYEASADLAIGGRPTVATLNSETSRVRARALEALDAQVQHLMGTFQSESFKDQFGYPGVLGERYDIRFTQVEPGSDAGRFKLTYKFKGTVVFDKRAFRSNETRKVPIKLPAAPDLIYALGVKRGVNHCTDEHYNSEGDFWYFWDPDMPGCPLIGDDVNVIRGEGKLVRQDNTDTTYPEYDRLYGDNGNGEDLDIALFIGYIDDVESTRIPNRRDDGMTALKEVEAELKDRGFALTEKKDAFREYADGREARGINFLRHYELPLDGGPKVKVQILLADTMISSNDATFHRYLVPAFRNSDIVVYDGHSGLGGNLDLRSLPRVGFKKDKYQIFFFNGCSSYPYFNGMFFNAKGGSRNLEVVTSGLPTYTDTAAPNMMAFLNGFLGGKKLSYQRILSTLEESNGENGTYLTGVNGDEDNRFKP